MNQNDSVTITNCFFQNYFHQHTLGSYFLAKQISNCNRIASIAHPDADLMLVLALEVLVYLN